MTERYALSVKIPPGFSSISATCIWASHRWEGAAPAPGGMLAGLHPEEQALPSAFGEPKGLLWGLSLCYFFGQAEQETSAALCCSQICSG